MRIVRNARGGPLSAAPGVSIPRSQVFLRWPPPRMCGAFWRPLAPRKNAPSRGCSPLFGAIFSQLLLQLFLALVEQAVEQCVEAGRMVVVHGVAEFVEDDEIPQVFG